MEIPSWNMIQCVYKIQGYIAIPATDIITGQDIGMGEWDKKVTHLSLIFVIFRVTPMLALNDFVAYGSVFNQLELWSRFRVTVYTFFSNIWIWMYVQCVVYVQCVMKPRKHIGVISLFKHITIFRWFIKRICDKNDLRESLVVWLLEWLKSYIDTEIWFLWSLTYLLVYDWDCL